MPKGNRGISQRARAEWSGQRITPNQEQQVLTFQIGLVMDDWDDQFMGRVWVYIPGFSTNRMDENSIPNYGGTAPDRQSGRLEYDSKLRDGWILCYPLFPFFGSDDYRVPSAPDGRNSRMGNVNSYGFWSQPRIGDNVGVLFAGGNPSDAYWIGGVPKQYRNFSVPGNAGQPQEEISDEGERSVKSKTNSNAMIPALDKTHGRENPQGDEQFPSNSLARNLLEAGLIYDTHRGAGTSTPRRESPSYVTGFKSPGWSYDSEKQNRDANGNRFEDRSSELGSRNTSGHQIVFDDHPDNQLIRIRTSFGSQVLLNDSCANPYIFMSTAKGNVWLELGDDGSLNVYGKKGFNVHAEQDINLTAGRNINMEAGSAVNMKAQGHNMEISESTNWVFDGDRRVHDKGDVSYTTTGTEYRNNEGDVNWTTAGSKYEQVEGGYGLSMEGNMSAQSSGGIYFSSSGPMGLEASSIWLNSGMTSSPGSPSSGETPEALETSDQPGPPGQSDVQSGSRPESRPYLGSSVPQHQPWSGSCGKSNTVGSNGYVGAVPDALPGQTPPPSNNNDCSRGSSDMNVRRGATSPRAERPSPVIGSALGQEEPGIYMGKPYNTNSRSEEPKRKLARAMRIGETNFPNSFNVSNKMMDFLKQQETFQQTPIKDMGGDLIIGFGHKIQVGDVIGGTEITQELYDTIRKGVNDLEQTISTTVEEAEQFLTSAISELQSTVEQLFGNVEMTQGQFDSTISMMRNIGPSNLQNTEQGKNIISSIQNGQMENVNDNAMKFVHTQGFVDCNQVDRRRGELDNNFNNPNDRDGIAGQAAEFTPTGPPVKVGNWEIDPAVKDAIDEAAQEHGVSREYMYALAAQESGFNPNAQAGTSSAKGLFQFTDGTWSRYGSGSQFDPFANSDAAARFALDNQNSLASGALDGVRQPNSTDLYMAHFLGAGDSNSGANGFLSELQSNPTAAPADDPSFKSAASANRNVFYYNDGTPKSYQEVYDYFDGRMTRRANQFSSLP